MATTILLGFFFLASIFVSVAALEARNFTHDLQPRLSSAAESTTPDRWATPMPLQDGAGISSQASM